MVQSVAKPVAFGTVFSGEIGATDSGEKSWLLYAWALALIIYILPALRPFPLLDPDEGLHASIAQEMVETGDFITPTFQGQPFFDKPILFFWCQATTLSLFGMNETGVRLPGLLFGLLGAVTTAFVASRLFDRRTGLVAGLMYMTTILPLALAQSAVHDVALVPWTNIALLAFWESRRSDTAKSSWRWTLLAGVMLGGACLTKGLIGVALVGVPYGLTLILSRRLTFGAIASGVAALTIGAVVAAPWYIAISLENPGFAYYYFVERHLLGYVTTTQTHGTRKWYYYLPIVLAGSLPWGMFLPAAAWDTLGRLRDRWTTWRSAANPSSVKRLDPLPNEHLLVWMWFLGGVLFLTVAKSKLFTYLSPVFPAMAILSAVLFQRLAMAKTSRVTSRLTGTMAILLCLIPLAGFPAGIAYALRRWPQQLPSDLVAWGALLGSLTLIPLAFWLWHRPFRSLGASLALTGLIFMGVLFSVLPSVALGFSAKQLAQHLRALPELPPQVLVVEERIGSLIFYLRANGRPPKSAEQIKFAEFDHPPDWNKLASGIEIAVPHRVVKRFERQIDEDLFSRQALGHYQLYRRR